MTATEWALIHHFQPGEFDSKDAPGSGFAGMQAPFVMRLDALRAQFGRAVIVVSGFRTVAHNAAVGGKPNSAHLRGLAGDVRSAGMEHGSVPETVRLLVAAVRIGFRRIGFDLEGKFLHVDTDPSLPSPALWFYPEVAPPA